MGAYLTKDNSGLVQLWNNEPELVNGCWQAWIIKGVNNEVGIDVTGNDYFRNVFTHYERPACLNIMVMYEPILKT